MRPMVLMRLLAVVFCALAAACTSTEDVLRPSALTSPATQPGGQLAALGSDFRLGFDPVVGADAEATRPLSARLSALAGESGIALAGPGAAASLSMKGYFSAISEDGVTLVIFVWDVVDPEGNRLHRIQGQQRATGGTGEGWAAVSDATMEAVAEETMSQLVAWLAMRQG